MIKEVCFVMLGAVTLPTSSASAEPKPWAKVVEAKLQLTSYRASDPCAGRKYKNTFMLAGVGTHTYRHVGYGMVYASGNTQSGTITLTAGRDTELSTYWSFDNGNKAGKTVYVDLSIDNGPPQHFSTMRDTCSTQMR